MARCPERFEETPEPSLPWDENFIVYGIYCHTVGIFQLWSGTLDYSNRGFLSICFSPEGQYCLGKLLGHDDFIMEFIIIYGVHGPT